MNDPATAPLLRPLKIRSVTVRNRIVVSPMCQYCAVDGMADDWHLVHLGSRAAGGAGLVFVEATAVTPEGRISTGDLGIWDDRHIEPLSRIARFVRRMGAVPAIQIAHAGRKASKAPPFRGGATLLPEHGGWLPVAPSPIPFREGDPLPRALDRDDLKSIVESFAAAARRATAAGFDVLEVHAAHGYLLHEFLSPLSNNRNDEYGGALEGRARLLFEVTRAVRSVLPETMPLFVRISASDWVEGGWDVGQSVRLAQSLGTRGVDVIDTSSGGILPGLRAPTNPGYNVPLASAIRDGANLLTGVVGLITEPLQANEIIASGGADLVFLAREMLREPYWALKAQRALQEEASWPISYGYAVNPRKA